MHALADERSQLTPADDLHEGEDIYPVERLERELRRDLKKGQLSILSSFLVIFLMGAYLIVLERRTAGLEEQHLKHNLELANLKLEIRTYKLQLGSTADDLNSSIASLKHTTLKVKLQSIQNKNLINDLAAAFGR